MLRLAVALLIAVTAVPHARAQDRRPAAIEPGTYDLEITFGGGVLEGTLEVATAGDSLAVKLHVGGHDSPARPAERHGSRLVLASATPGVQVRYVLEFRGDAVSGTFTYEGQDGTLTGRRRSTPGR